MSSIEAYINSLEDKRVDMTVLDEFISSTLPQLKRQLLDDSTQPMIGYGELKDGKKHARKWPLIGVAAKRSYISMFIAPDPQGNPLADLFDSERMGKVKCGKHSLKFMKLDDLNLIEFKEVLLEVVDKQQGETDNE